MKGKKEDENHINEEAEGSYNNTSSTGTNSEMEKIRLVFTPSPLMGHMGQAVEFARFLHDRFSNISVSVLVAKLPGDPVGNTYAESLSSTATDGISFHYLPSINPSPEWNFETPGDLVDLILEEQKPYVRDIVRRLIRQPDGNSQPTRVAGFIVDMLCTSMVDIGKELGLPSYVLFTSNAAYLGLMLHLQTLHDKHNQDISKLIESPTELIIPSYAVPVPPSMLPKKLINKHWWSFRFLAYCRKYREAEGIIVNTFADLEPHALSSYDSQTPPVYTVGPMLKGATTSANVVAMQWLDVQPESSVVFLCFGSRGYFNVDQAREIAIGLERSGYRFLWSLRQPPTTGVTGFPGEYKDPHEVLPDGFLERTAGVGKVIGWAPQLAVLSHMAVGGFVSHCGWNSTLESLWCGVPLATWPRYAEQQMNAYQLVKELGLGVEISPYDQLGSQPMVMAEKIENGIRCLMDGNSEVRARVKEMQAKSRMAQKEGGSSFTCLQSLFHNIMNLT